MDKTKGIEITEKIQEQIKELFKEFSSEELYDAWADTFEIERICGNKVVIYYHGTENISLFKKECKVPLQIAVYSAFGAGKKIKISKKSKLADKLSPKTKKNIRALKFFIIGMIFVCIATSVIVVMCNYISNRDFRETFYITSSIKVDSSIRIIQLSDSHNASYGNGNERLLERVEALKPDIIICTGDMVNSTQNDVDHAISLAQGLSRIAPSYYIYGNNEEESIYNIPLVESELDKKFGFNDDNRDEAALLQVEDSFEESLENAGIKVLKNEKDTLKVKSMTIDIYGVLTSNPSSFWSYSGKAFSDYLYKDTDNIKITAIHEPFIFEKFTNDSWGDLIVCGHTHGGIVRVPLLGPLFTHEAGLFPERKGSFAYGRYDISGGTLIVSSGLENSNVFRINNQPELVVIDINKF